MLRIEGADYRRSREAALLEGLRAGDPLALAEVYHRTSPAAHACARRLLGSARDAEALLAAVYAEVWDTPPETARLEGWMRSRTFRLGAAHLREHGRAPAAPSLALLLPDLPAPDSEATDAAEQLLAGLDEDDRRALLLAHDQGVPAAAQDAADAPAALDRALMALAGPGEGVDDGSSQECSDLEGLPDWVLGTLAADHAARITAAVVDRSACSARSRALRRGRRRMEGLPPAPDMGHRIIATVLAGIHGGPAAAASSAASPSPAPVEPAPGPAPAGPGPAPAPSAPPAPSDPPPSLTAPLPSALDEEPAAAPSAAPAEPADGAPAGNGWADDDTPDAALDTPAERVPTSATEDAGPASFALADADVAGGRREQQDEDPASGAGFAPDAEAAAEDVVSAEGADTDEADEASLDDHAVTDDEQQDVSATANAPAPTGKRTIARRLLNIVAILAVLAAGSAIGLLIGFLLVRGR